MANLDFEIIARARNLAINEYPRDPRDCIRQAVSELVTDKVIKDVCALFDITKDEYLSDKFYNNLYEDYQKLICKELGICWRRAINEKAIG